MEIEWQRMKKESMISNAFLKGPWNIINNISIFFWVLIDCLVIDCNYFVTTYIHILHIYLIQS